MIGDETALESEDAAKPATAWGKSISDERQGELQEMLDAWKAGGVALGDSRGPFAGVQLTGAEVFWLAGVTGRDPIGAVPNLHLEGATLRRAHLEGATLRRAHLEGATLSLAHLEGATLNIAHLEGATLRQAYMKGCRLRQAHLGGADLGSARLEDAALTSAHLEGADLSSAHLEGADLNDAHLEGADLSSAHLEQADLSEAHLEGTNLTDAHLQSANLVSAWMDTKTLLIDAVLDQHTKLGDIHWSGVGGVNLTRLNWQQLPALGDEDGLGKRSTAEEYEAAVRTYRQLATQLRAQGMTETADRFSYRAQVLQRPAFRLRSQWGRWMETVFLDAVSGHGYMPMRSIITFLVVVLGFANLYFFLGESPSLGEALVVSLTAFLGRGFLAFQPSEPLAAVAAIEALAGLLIELTVIVTFTQRFFSR